MGTKKSEHDTHATLHDTTTRKQKGETARTNQEGMPKSLEKPPVLKVLPISLKTPVMGSTWEQRRAQVRTKMQESGYVCVCCLPASWWTWVAPTRVIHGEDG